MTFGNFTRADGMVNQTRGLLRNGSHSKQFSSKRSCEEMGQLKSSHFTLHQSYFITKKPSPNGPATMYSKRSKGHLQLLPRLFTKLRSQRLSFF